MENKPSSDPIFATGHLPSISGNLDEEMAVSLAHRECHLFHFLVDISASSVYVGTSNQVGVT
jgi:hypothetical protein